MLRQIKERLHNLQNIKHALIISYIYTLHLLNLIVII